MIIQKDYTGWKYYTHINEEGDTFNVGIKKTDSNGITHSVSLQDPDVIRWLEEGNTPLPADE